MGSGQIELSRALFGKLPLRRGTISLDGKPVRLKSTAAARARGIAFVPENRRMMLFRQEPVYKNVSISILDRIHRLFVKPQAERKITEGHIKDLQIRPPRTGIALGSLSGATSRRWRWPSGLHICRRC